jgi:hypothetical protein
MQACELWHTFSASDDALGQRWGLAAANQLNVSSEQFLRAIDATFREHAEERRRQLGNWNERNDFLSS